MCSCNKLIVRLLWVVPPLLGHTYYVIAFNFCDIQTGIIICTQDYNHSLSLSLSLSLQPPSSPSISSFEVRLHCSFSS